MRKRLTTRKKLSFILHDLVSPLEQFPRAWVYPSNKEMRLLAEQGVGVAYQSRGYLLVGTTHIHRSHQPAIHLFPAPHAASHRLFPVDNYRSLQPRLSSPPHPLPTQVSQDLPTDSSEGGDTLLCRIHCSATAGHPNRCTRGGWDPAMPHTLQCNSRTSQQMHQRGVTPCYAAYTAVQEQDLPTDAPEGHTPCYAAYTAVQEHLNIEKGWNGGGNAKSQV